MEIKWEKRKIEIKTLEDRYTIADDVMITGLVSVKHPNQDLSVLVDNFEVIDGVVSYLPFVKFIITKKNNEFMLLSNSEISLKNYKKLDLKQESWKTSSTIEGLMQTAQKLIEDFKSNIGTGKENNIVN